jgi:hypothetical protein
MKTYYKTAHNSNNKTRKHSRISLSGKVEGKRGGWIKICIWGGAYERGYAHGRLLHRELSRVVQIFPFVVKKELNASFSNYLETSNQYLLPIVRDHYPEYYEEMRGIVDGYRSTSHKKSASIDIHWIIAWNAYMSLYSLYKEGGSERCSAFIACGDSTEKGDMIMAHNTHSDYVSGGVFNIIMTIVPSDGKGGAFRMQTAPGLISSITDWFVCANGLIGCETTISNIKYRPQFGSPLFCRIRDVMQYANSLDDMMEILLKWNAGDYASSWLFGDIRTNEIMRFEIGLKQHSVERTNNGVFYGMNSAVDYALRNLETTDNGGDDLNNSSGSRSYRLYHLLTEKYGGKLNMENAKKIMADHYDETKNANVMGSRGICRHTELDQSTMGRRAYYPFGCTDGKVINSKMAKEMHFVGRWGSCCGRVFKGSDFVKMHPMYKEYKEYLPDFPKETWVNL